MSKPNKLDKIVLDFVAPLGIYAQVFEMITGTGHKGIIPYGALTCFIAFCYFSFRHKA